MSKNNRGMPRSLVRSTSPKTVDATDGPADPEQQGRGLQPAEPARAKRDNAPKKELKVVGVPLDVFRQLELEAIESGRTLSQIVVELLGKHLPRRVVQIRGKSESSSNESATSEADGPDQGLERAIAG